ncbi:MAG: hypothetical protein ACLFPX_04660 [Candidatus Omnitrophota bacterium]
MRLLDIYATVLDSLDLDAPQNIDSRSLLPLIMDPQRSLRTVFAETGYSLNFEYQRDLYEQGRQTRKELKRFKVDPRTGYVFIKDQDYGEILQQKQYMLVEGKHRFVRHPLSGKSVLYDMKGAVLQDPVVHREMSARIEKILSGGYLSKTRSLLKFKNR